MGIFTSLRISGGIDANILVISLISATDIDELNCTIKQSLIRICMKRNPGPRKIFLRMASNP
jgi:hypothetical protein